MIDIIKKKELRKMDNNNPYNPGGSQEQPPQYHNPYAQEAGGKGLAVASMVLGIVAVVIFCFFYVSLPIAITGVILGIISLAKRKNGKGMAVAGVVLNSAAIVLAILFFVGIMLAFYQMSDGAMWPDFWDEFARDFQI
jgi:cytochrome b subunit of formate dehydrogenase